MLFWSLGIGGEQGLYDTYAHGASVPLGEEGSEQVNKHIDCLGENHRGCNCGRGWTAGEPAWGRHL